MPDRGKPAQVAFTRGELPAGISALDQFKQDLSDIGVKRWGKITDEVVEFSQRNVLDTMHASKERVLEKAQSLISDALEGKRFSGQAEFISQMRKTLGFPTDGKFGDHGSISSLASDQRLRMIYDMQMTRAHAQIKQAEDKASGMDILFPAQELVRGASVKEPRDWIARWSEAGGQFYEGRMVALKDDPIWTKISAFGEPTPPFDYNSQMVTDDVSVQEAVRLGLLPEDAIEKSLDDFNEHADDEDEELPDTPPEETTAEPSRASLLAPAIEEAVRRSTSKPAQFSPALEEKEIRKQKSLAKNPYKTAKPKQQARKR